MLRIRCWTAKPDKRCRCVGSKGNGSLHGVDHRPEEETKMTSDTAATHKSYLPERVAAEFFAAVARGDLDAVTSM